MAGVIGNNTLPHLPSGYILADFDNLTGEFVAADRAELFRSIINIKMFHVGTTDCRRFDFDDYIIISASRLWNINEMIGSKL